MITGIAPQFLVEDLDRAIAYYRDRLGFDVDFVYESFYASVSRDGFAIHLKHAPKIAADRAHRKANEHLDAHIAVSGIRDLFGELAERGADVMMPLTRRAPGRAWSSTSRIPKDTFCVSARLTRHKTRRAEPSAAD